METSPVPIGTSFNLLKYLYDLLSKINRNKRLKGYYLVHHRNNPDPVNNSPERIPNFLRLHIDFFKPNTLHLRSRDYDATYTKKWKTWIGKITLYDDDYGYGWYNYLDTNEPGNHEIWPKQNGEILVRVVDKGKANLRERRDNDPATQKWVRVHDDDPRIGTFEKML